MRCVAIRHDASTYTYAWTLSRSKMSNVLISSSTTLTVVSVIPDVDVERYRVVDLATRECYTGSVVLELIRTFDI